MKKYKIWYDIGYGRTHDEVEADDDEDVTEIIHELMVEEMESNSDWAYDLIEDDIEDS